MVVEVLDYGPEHDGFEETVELLARALGKYVHETDFTDPDRFVLHAVDDGGIVGGVVGHLKRRDDTLEWAAHLERAAPRVTAGDLSPLVARLRECAVEGVPVGDLYAIAVADAARGRGAGTALVRACRRRLGAGGAALVVTEAWHNPDAPDARGVFEAAGFELAGVVREYWLEQGVARDDPHREGCSHCGDVCRCTASVYSASGPY